MDLRLGFLFIALAIKCISSNARSMVTSEVPVTVSISSNRQLCNLCDAYASRALHYLGKNETQTEIIAVLHKGCSRMHASEQQCRELVDKYARVLFTDIAKMEPDEFCGKLRLCELASIHVSDGSCLLCKTALAPMIAQLNDPATKYLLKQMLLKNCDKFTSENEDCETVVDKYITALIDNAKDYLQDICTVLHFCSTRSETMIDSAVATA